MGGGAQFTRRDGIIRQDICSRPGLAVLFGTRQERHPGQTAPIPRQALGIITHAGHAAITGGVSIALGQPVVPM